VTLTIALLAGAGAALAPAMSTLSATPDPRSHRRDNLIAQQLAVSFALLVAVGLVWNEQQRLRNPSLGYDAERVLVTTIDLSRLGYSGARAAAAYSDLFTQVEAMPGVRALAVSTHPPFRGGLPSLISVAAADGPRVDATVRGVSPGYFQMLDIRVVAGRLFSESEAQSQAAVIPVVVSQAFARRLSSRGETLGRRLQLPENVSAQIVGVAAAGSTIRLGESDGAIVYRPLSAAGRWSRAPTASRLALLVATSDTPQPLAEAVRERLRAIDPDIQATLQTIAESIDSEADRYATVVTFTATLAVVAAVLAIIGMYGVIAFGVARRAKEIGIRTALGANARDVAALFVWSLRRPVSIGLTAGALLAVLGGWWLQYARLLPAGQMHHGAALAAAAFVLLGGASVLAAVFPAFRAARTNPWGVLRND
jgi:putative ABC transport system permease protein